MGSGVDMVTRWGEWVGGRMVEGARRETVVGGSLVGSSTGSLCSLPCGGVLLSGEGLLRK